MPLKTNILLFLLLVTHHLAAQNFGCYDVSGSSNVYDDFVYIRSKSMTEIEWDDFNIKEPLDSGIVGEYYGYKIHDTIPSLKMKGLSINGKQEGPWVLYSMMHTEKATGNFINGKKEGQWKVFTQTNQGDTFLSKVILFKNDIVDGIKLRLNEVGDTIRIEEFNHGKPFGVRVSLLNHKQDTFAFTNYPNGKKNGRCYARYKPDSIWRYYYDVNYLNDNLSGDVKIYYRNGILRHHIIYKHNIPFTVVEVRDIMGTKLDGGTLTEGSGTLNYYRDSGQLETSFTYKDGAINGHIVHYYSSKEIMEQGNYFSFRDTTMPPIDINLDRYEDYNIKAAHQLIMKSGTSYSTFDKKGTIESSIKAANNLLSDTILITDFNENKTYSSRGSLVYGSKIGIYERYNEVGTIESKINYKLAYDSIRWWFSVKDGKALFYHENSFLKAEIWYENDKEVGESFYYNDNGQLVRTRILYPNGSSINIFKGDTVNYTDSAGRKQGKWLSFEIYSCSETPTEIQYYKNDNPCDVWTSYSDGIISGKKYWIDSTYCDSEWYFANGRLRAKGKWKYDYFFGKWKWYHEKTGELEKEGFHGWSKNWTMEKQGEWIIYNKKGRPKRIEYYIDGELEATRRP